MKVAPEFLPADEGGTLKLLDRLDDFMITDHSAQRRVSATEQVVEIRYYNELPLRYHEDNFLTSLHVTIRADRYKDRGNVRGEYHATFMYIDETKTPLYGRSYFIKRFAGNRLDMMVQCTADEVEAYVEQAQPDIVIPRLWHDATKYDVRAFSWEFRRLRRCVREAQKSAS